MVTACHQGETQYLDFPVVTSGGLPANLSGTTIVFSYLDHGILKTHANTVALNVITVKFTPAETALLLGVYDYALKITDGNGDIDVLHEGTFQVTPGLVESS